MLATKEPTQRKLILTLPFLMWKPILWTTSQQLL